MQTTESPTSPFDKPIKIMGLDLSLGATGIAINDTATVFKPKSTIPMIRLAEFRKWIHWVLREERPSMAVIEGYAFGAKNSREVLGELHSVIKLALYDMTVPFALVPPTVLKKFATGVGNAGKDQMVYAAARAGCPASDNNAVDAWWLQKMCQTHFQLPGMIVGLPKNQSSLTNKVDWPMRFAP
jgi:Holliday junction resolvasome RuvABC endonuclease subunit